MTTAPQPGTTSQPILTIGLATFLIGFSLSLFGGTVFLPNKKGCSVSFADSHHRQCRRLTKAGLCVEDVFNAVDSVYRDQWPGTVDLLIRSSASGRFFLMEMVFESIDQMWPKGIGDVVLVLNEKDQEAVSLVPPWVKVFFEENILKLPQNLVHQWSYGWADKYTTAEFVAISADDVMFIMKVTPPLLFNLTEGRPYVIGSSRNQSNAWIPATDYFVGKRTYRANFVVQQPFVAPRGAFKAYRGHVENLHPEKGGYDAAFKGFIRKAPRASRNRVQLTSLGNFLLHNAADEVHVAMEWSYHTPIPRVAAQVRWTTAYGEGSNFEFNEPQYSSLYITSAAKYAHEGLCLSFPHGELPGCEAISAGQRQDQVWRFAHDWQDWPMLLYAKDSNGTQVYDQHRKEMHCIYHQLSRFKARGKGGTGGWLSKQAIDKLKPCIRH